MARFNYGYYFGTWSKLRATYDGYRNPQGGQDSNIDLDDDDMSRLQDIAPADYMDYRRPERDDDRERDRDQFEYDRSGDLQEQDYFEGLERSRNDSRYADRYTWDQYDGGYSYRY